jgi:hypothetical protein
MHVKAIPSSASETAEAEAGLAAKGPFHWPQPSYF